MLRFLLLFGGFTLPFAAGADNAPSCLSSLRCVSPVSVALWSVAEDVSYAVILDLPMTECPATAYRVIDSAALSLGRGAPPQAARVFVLRIGRDYAAGAHDLRVVTEGSCSAQPVAARMIRLEKPSPDRSWRGP